MNAAQALDTLPCHGIAPVPFDADTDTDTAVQRRRQINPRTAGPRAQCPSMPITPVVAHQRPSRTPREA